MMMCVKLPKWSYDGELRTSSCECATNRSDGLRTKGREMRSTHILRLEIEYVGEAHGVWAARAGP